MSKFEISVRRPIQRGDIWYYKNPLQKEKSVMENTSQLCGDRPILITNVEGNYVVGYECKSKLQDHGQIVLDNKKGVTYNTNACPIFTSPGEIYRYCGHIDDDSIYKYISLIGSFNNIPFTATQKLYVNIQFGPLNKFLSYNNDKNLYYCYGRYEGKYYLAKCLYLEQNEDKEITDGVVFINSGNKYLLTSDISIFNPRTKYTLSGSADSDVRSMVFGWITQDKLFSITSIKQQELQELRNKVNAVNGYITTLMNRTKISTNKTTKPSVKPKRTQVPDVLTTPPLELTNKTEVKPLIDVKTVVKGKVKEKRTTILLNIYTDSAPELTEDETVPFTEYFDTTNSNNPYTYPIKSKKDLLNSLVVTKGDWINRSLDVKHWKTRNYILYNAINWNLAPYSIRQFESTIKQYAGL